MEQWHNFFFMLFYIDGYMCNVSSCIFLGRIPAMSGMFLPLYFQFTDFAWCEFVPPFAYMPTLKQWLVAYEPQ